MRNKLKKELVEKAIDKIKSLRVTLCCIETMNPDLFHKYIQSYSDSWTIDTLEQISDDLAELLEVEFSNAPIK